MSVWLNVKFRQFLFVYARQRIFRVVVLVCSEITEKTGNMFVYRFKSIFPTKRHNDLLVDPGGRCYYSAFLIAGLIKRHGQRLNLWFYGLFKK